MRDNYPWRPEPEPAQGELVPDHIMTPTQPDLKQDSACLEAYHALCGWESPEGNPKLFRVKS